MLLVKVLRSSSIFQSKGTPFLLWKTKGVRYRANSAVYRRGLGWHQLYGDMLWLFLSCQRLTDLCQAIRQLLWEIVTPAGIRIKFWVSFTCKAWGFIAILLPWATAECLQLAAALQLIQNRGITSMAISLIYLLPAQVSIAALPIPNILMKGPVFQPCAQLRKIHFEEEHLKLCICIFIYR